MCYTCLKTGNLKFKLNKCQICIYLQKSIDLCLYTSRNPGFDSQKYEIDNVCKHCYKQWYNGMF